jgi:hypothetical protein
MSTSIWFFSFHDFHLFNFVSRGQDQDFLADPEQPPQHPFPQADLPHLDDAAGLRFPGDADFNVVAHVGYLTF